MSNFTSILSRTNDTGTAQFLDELLDRLGFNLWQTVLNIFILPLINLAGVAFCSFSLWIFSRSPFVDPIFFYYKLLCVVNIVLLLHNVPFGILFSPRFFPMIDTFIANIYQIYYSTVFLFLFHFLDVLQMAILLHKMKLYVPFIRQHFKARPQFISLTFFFTCLIISIPVAFSLKINAVGNYFYFDSNGVKKFSTLYFTSSSDFSQTTFGQILLGFTVFFLNLFLSLLLGIMFNISSYIKYTSYSRKKKKEVEELQMSSIHNKLTTNKEMEQQRKRERTEREIEKNMFRMALTLSSISILSRTLFMACYIYFFYDSTFSNNLLIKTAANLILTLMPTISIFVFYFFNKMFRDETKKVVSKLVHFVFAKKK